MLSVQIDRPTFVNIFHDRVTPENALRNFPLRFSYDNVFRLKPVQPFSIPQDIQSASGRNTAVIDLDAIDPLDFEELIRQLLERMGYQATLTKASHDGGIDVEALYLLTWAAPGAGSSRAAAAGLTPGRRPAMMSACPMTNCAT
jgi:hypothetical protein